MLDVGWWMVVWDWTGMDVDDGGVAVSVAVSTLRNEKKAIYRMTKDKHPTFWSN
jgi:hypothetical protein